MANGIRSSEASLITDNEIIYLIAALVQQLGSYFKSVRFDKTLTLA